MGKLYSEYLKSQFNPNKNNRYEPMSEEEFRLNRELIDDINNDVQNYRSSKKAFLIWNICFIYILFKV